MMSNIWPEGIPPPKLLSSILPMLVIAAKVIQTTVLACKSLYVQRFGRGGKKSDPALYGSGTQKNDEKVSDLEAPSL